MDGPEERDGVFETTLPRVSESHLEHLAAAATSRPPLEGFTCNMVVAQPA